MRVENVEISGLESSIVASGYPMRTELNEPFGEKAVKRCNKLCKAGGAEEQFLTGITVNFDLTCSNKMWVEAERYRFLNFVSSQSTMHRITKFDLGKSFNEYVDSRIIDILKEKIDEYNAEANSVRKKEKYLRVLYNVPSGFELTTRLSTNYRCLKNIYYQRRSHRLPEWQEFCKWIETLPLANELLLTTREK